MQRIKKGDKVVVISGKNQGASGIVLKILTKKNAALIEGVNKVKKNQKGDDRNSKKSEIIEIEAPVLLCKLALIDFKAKSQPKTKVKFMIDPKTQKKVRLARKSGNPIGGK